MRYYSISIGGASGAFPGRYDGGAQWGTLLNGKNDPNAQQVEFHIEEYSPDTPNENSVLTIQGVHFDQIKQSADLVGKTIRIFGGMKSNPALPLSHAQSRNNGLLMEGIINRCWGNWIGHDTSIGMSFMPASLTKAEQAGSQAAGMAANVQKATDALLPAPKMNRTGFRSIDRRTFPQAQNPSFGQIPVISQRGVGGSIMSFADFGAASQTIGGMAASLLGGGNTSPLQTPLNIIHNLEKNMPLSGAIKETLGKVFPKANVNMLISSALKLGYQDAGMYQSMEQYAGYINKLSNSILGTDKYQGIKFGSKSKTINVFDGTTPVSEGNVSYLDLIGQPTWIGPFTVNLKVVLRGNLEIGSRLFLPQTLMATTPEAMIPMMPEQRKNLSFAGAFRVLKVLHIGDFRNPDGASWCTNYECILEGVATGANELEKKVNPPETQTVITIKPPGGASSFPPLNPADNPSPNRRNSNRRSIFNG